MYGAFKFHLVGTVTQDVEYSTMQNGQQRATVNLAVNTPFKKQDGSYDQQTTWVRLAFFGKATERKTLQECVKGTAVYAEGHVSSYKQEISGKNYTFYTFRPDVIRVVSPRKAKAEQGASDPGTQSDWDADQYADPEAFS